MIKPIEEGEMVQTGNKRYPAGEHRVLPRTAACISFDSGEHCSPLRFRMFQPFDNEKSLSTRGISVCQKSQIGVLRFVRQHA